MVVVVDDIVPPGAVGRAPAFAELLPSVEESHQTLLHLGVPAERLPRDPAADVVGLVCTIDRLFASGCGHAGIKGFLSTPDAELGGRAPTDVLSQPDGVDLIRDLIRREIRAARSL